MIGPNTVYGDNLGNIASTGGRIVEVKGTYIDVSTHWIRPNRPDPQRRRLNAYGREDELLRLHNSIQKHEQVVIAGLTGVGKSTLASMYADRYNSPDYYKGGVLWVDLGYQFRDPARCRPVLEQWASWAFGGSLPILQANVQVTFEPEIVAQLLSNHGPMLIVLDDLWAPEAVEPLLRACPSESRILVTTRLGDVLPTFFTQPLGKLDKADAMILLREKLPDISGDTYEQLALAFGYHAQALSLAIESIRRRFASTSQEAIARELIAQAYVGGSSDQGEEAQQENVVSIALHASYAELGEDPTHGAMRQQCLRTLGALGPPDSITEVDFDVMMVAELWGTSPDAAAPLLEALVARSLLTPSGQGRWSIHPLVRNYARSLLEQTGDWEASHRTYISYILTHSEQLLDVPPGAPIPDHIHIAYAAAQVAATLMELPTHPNTDEAETFQRQISFLQTLAPHILLRQELSRPGELWLSAGIKAAAVLGLSESEALLRTSLAQLYLSYGQASSAHEQFTEMLELARAENGVALEAWSLNGLGVSYRYSGENETALAYYEQALVLVRTLDDDTMLAYVLNNLGELYTVTAQYVRALDCLRQAVPKAASTDDLYLQIGILHTMALLHLLLNEPEETLLVLAQAEKIIDKLGNKNVRIYWLNLYGVAQLGSGALEQAQHSFDEALEIAQAAQLSQEQGAVLNSLGLLHQRKGQMQQALEYFNKAYDLLEHSEDKSSTAHVLANIGQTLHVLGQNDRALDRLQQALPLLRAVKDHRSVVGVLYLIGKIYHETGRYQEGISYFEQALPAIRAIEHGSADIAVLTWLGLLFQDIGDTGRALELFEQVLPVLQRVENIEERATALLMAVMVYASTGELSRATMLAEQVCELSSERGLEQHEAEAHMLLTSLYIRTEQIERASEHVAHGYVLAEQQHNLPMQVQLTAQQAFIHIARGELDTALELLNTIEPSAVTNIMLEFQVTYQRALCHLLREQFQLAREQLESLYDQLSGGQLPEQEVAVLVLLSFAFFMQPGQQHIGIRRMQEAITLVGQHSARGEISNLNVDILHELLAQMRADQTGGEGKHQGVEDLLELLIQTPEWSTVELLIRANEARLQSLSIDGLEMMLSPTIEDMTVSEDEVGANVLRTYRSILGWCTESDGIETALRRARTYLESDYMYAWWGRLYRANRAYSRALISLNRAIDLAPRVAAHLIERGWIYRGLGSYSRALDDFHQALALSPEHAEAGIGLAALAYEHGNYMLALDYLRNVLERQPTHPHARHWYGTVLLAQGDADAAVAYFSYAITADAYKSDHYYWRSLARLEAGQNIEAIDDLDRLVELDRDEPDLLCFSLIWRGVAYMLQGHETSSQADWARASQTTEGLPPNEIRHFACALVAMLRGDQAEAREHYVAVLHRSYIRHRLTTQREHLRRLARLFPDVPRYATLSDWLDLQLLAFRVEGPPASAVG